MFKKRFLLTFAFISFLGQNNDLLARENYLLQLKETGNCIACDLKKKDLSGTDLSFSNLNETNLKLSNLVILICLRLALVKAIYLIAI